MEVILLEKVERLGGLGDRVAVKSGFARNCLNVVPPEAMPYSTGTGIEFDSGEFALNMDDALALADRSGFEARREDLERREAEALAAAEQRANVLEGVEIAVLRKAGEGGRLFGSVGAADIAQAMGELGHDVTRQQVRMPGGEPIRQLGEYAVSIHVDADVEATIGVKVEPEPPLG